MRIFKAEDGRSWVARLHDGMEARGRHHDRVGWEIIQFDREPPGTVQRIVYRPAGWLDAASLAELINALREGDNVRASWRE